MRSPLSPESGSGVLHNMSAPPRARIRVCPLRREDSALDAGDISPPSRGESGLALVTTIDLRCLIQSYFPNYRDSGYAGQPYWWDEGGLRGKAARREDLRLRCLVVLSRLAVGELRRPDRRVVFRLAGASTETLEQLWLDNVRRLKPGDLGLPPFGLIRPAPRPSLALQRTRYWEASPARALAVFSRHGGSVYSAGREPGLPDYQRPLRPIQLFAMNSGWTP